MKGDRYLPILKFKPLLKITKISISSIPSLSQHSLIPYLRKKIPKYAEVNEAVVMNPMFKTSASSTQINVALKPFIR